MSVDDEQVSDPSRRRSGGETGAQPADDLLDDALGQTAAHDAVAPAEEYFAPPVAPTAPAEQPIPRRGAPQRRPSAIDRRAAGRLRARKVRRLIRHVEPWSVLKISLLFYFCLWAIMLISGVLLWSAATGSGTIDNIETFIRELFALQTFEFDADQIFRASAVGGLVLVVAATGFNVLMAVLFNLISDLTGGIRVTVIEEETARPRLKSKRRRPAAVASDQPVDEVGPGDG